MAALLFAFVGWGVFVVLVAVGFRPGWVALPVGFLSGLLLAAMYAHSKGLRVLELVGYSLACTMLGLPLLVYLTLLVFPATD